MKHIFILNPKAALFSGIQEFCEEITSVFFALEAEYYVFVTEHPGHAQELTSSLCSFFRDRKVRFYSCGGGGTLFEIINGVYDFKNTEIAVVPMGKSNDILYSFFDGVTAHNDLWGIVHGSSVALDVMHINSTFYALNHICFGHEKPWKRYVSGKYLRMLYDNYPTLQNVAFAIAHSVYGHWREYTIEIDDTVREQSLSMAVIMNGSRYDGKVLCDRVSDMSDGLAQGIFGGDKSLLGLAHSLYCYPQRSPVKKMRMYTCTGENFSICRKDKKEILLNVDGENMAVERLSIKVLPELINFVMPQRILGGH